MTFLITFIIIAITILAAVVWDLDKQVKYLLGALKSMDEREQKILIKISEEKYSKVQKSLSDNLGITSDKSAKLIREAMQVEKEKM